MSEFDTEHIDRFLRRVDGMKADQTYKSARSALKLFDEWLSETGNSVEDVGPLDIEDFIVYLSSEGYAPSSIESYYHGVRGFYKFLDRDDILDENPAEDVDKGSVRSLMKGPGNRKSPTWSTSQRNRLRR